MEVVFKGKRYQIVERYDREQDCVWYSLQGDKIEFETVGGLLDFLDWEEEF
jgi:hypothetical protein